tara:strand:+ start:324 stop:1328 length:1005 start_codon:yes stop_codon:yes gene_type:complete
LTKSKILITGASGCVGQYIADWLLKNSNEELLLWVRDSNKLKAVSKTDPRVHLLIGDIRQASKFKNELQSVKRVIHTATAWGDPTRAYEVNVLAVKTLLGLLDTSKIEQIIYFSTASILDKDLHPIQEAFKDGTEYIQTKAQCYKDLENHELSEKIIAVFPTLVFGGRIDGQSLFPTSYLTSGIKEAFKWIWLARWFRAYSKFHFIHAADIAFICGYLSTHPHNKNNEPNQGKIRRLVLGQPSLSIDHAVDILLDWKKMRKVPRLPLYGWLVKALIRVLPLQLTSWDRFSIKQRHFEHKPISTPERFGGESHAQTLQQVLIDSGIPKLKSPKRR